MLQEKEGKSKKRGESNLKETACFLMTGKGVNAHPENCL